MSTQILEAGLDPTGRTQITGAELLQMVQAATFASTVGGVIETTDVADVPQVPAADTETSLQRFFWRRITSTGILLYAWDPNADSDATYLQWTNFLAISIPFGSVTNDMLAGSISNDKISSLAFSKLTGVPSYLASGAAAGGDLTGTFPNPTIANDAVTTAKILDGTVTAAKLDSLVGAKMVQEVVATNATYDNTNVTITNDDSPPEIAQGKEHITASITPKALTNRLRVEFTSFVSNNTANANNVIALFFDANNDAIQAVGAAISGTVGTLVPVKLVWEGLVSSLIGALAAITFRIRFGPGGATTAYILGSNTERKFGGIATSVLTVTEIRP